MKLAQLLEKAKESNEYKEFMKEYPEAFLAAGFFVLDDVGEDKFQLDFFIPGTNKIAISVYPFDNMKIQEDNIKDIKKLDENLKIDVTDLRLKVDEVLKENKINLRVSKIIAILKDNKWNLTCMGSTLDLVRIFIDSLTGKVEKCEKVNFFDIVNVKKK